VTIIFHNHAGPAAAAVLPARAGAPAPDSIADIAERLMGEFGGQLDLSVISRTVLDCRDDLACPPTGAPPSLVERLARERLLRTAHRSSLAVLPGPRGSP
jgi:hypothetical protein